MKRENQSCIFSLPISKIIHSLGSGYWHGFSGSLMSELRTLQFYCCFLCDCKITPALAISSSSPASFFFSRPVYFLIMKIKSFPEDLHSTFPFISELYHLTTCSRNGVWEIKVLAFPGSIVGQSKSWRKWVVKIYWGSQSTDC